MISAQDKRIVCAPELKDIITSSFFGLSEPLSASMVYREVNPVAVGGRNAAWFVEHERFSGVLRQYRRGGLIGKLVKQSYWWSGADKTRPWQEFAVMDYLYQQDFPVPQPLAAMYVRQGFLYKGALITAKIVQAKTLVEYIEHLAPTEFADLAAKLTRVIERMHTLKVNHADLNAFNILIDNQEQIYIIDFDKAKIEPSQGQWCQANYQRLERHLLKVLGERGQQFMVYIRQNLTKI
ncbi:MAG: 3-deoxy-D-manno-octulosonic acid kinase [Pelistega sp.]|nr:3-deoxy-D-manno-octulosonic acid kinase [Pelistega sp.]